MSVLIDINRFMRKEYSLISSKEVDTDGENINNTRNTLTTRFM